MKTYSQAPEASNCIEQIQAAHHEDLKDVTVSALFVFDDESSDSVLKHQGYHAAEAA